MADEEPNTVLYTSLWTGLFVVSCISFSVSFFFFLAILSSKKVRVHLFNIYIAALLIPDTVFNGSGIFSDAGRGHAEKSYSSTWCKYYICFGIFYILSTLWLNLVVTREAYIMICDLYKRNPRSRTRRKAIIQISSVLFFSAVITLISMENSNPYHNLETGDCEANLFKDIFSVILIPSIFLPIFYLAYIFGVVWCKNMLPVSGKTRVLFAFFRRLAIIPLAFMVPFIFLFILSNRLGKAWIKIISLYILRFVGPVSVALSMTKPDISNAVTRWFSKSPFSNVEPGENASTNSRRIQEQTNTTTVSADSENVENCRPSLNQVSNRRKASLEWDQEDLLHPSYYQ